MKTNSIQAHGAVSNNWNHIKAENNVFVPHASPGGPMAHKNKASVAMATGIIRAVSIILYN